MASSPRIVSTTFNRRRQSWSFAEMPLSLYIVPPRAQASRRCETQAPLSGKPPSCAKRFGPLTPSARSGNLIAGDGMKNGLSRSEQRTVSKTQKQPLDRKSPIQVWCEPVSRGYSPSYVEKPGFSAVRAGASGAVGRDAQGAATSGLRVVISLSGAREGTVAALGFVKHWNVRLDPALLHEPVEHLGRPVGGVADQALGVQLEAFQRALDHTLCRQGFGLAGFLHRRVTCEPDFLGHGWTRS